MGTRAVFAGGVVVLVLGIGAETVRRKLPSDWRTRRNVALNCLRGRPTLYRLRVVPQPMLNVAPGVDGLVVADCSLDGGYTGVKFGVEAT